MGVLMFGHNPTTGRMVLRDDKEQRFEFDREDIPNLAVMLAQECDDNGSRAFVRSEWSDVDDSEEWDGTDAY